MAVKSDIGLTDKWFSVQLGSQDMNSFSNNSKLFTDLCVWFKASWLEDWWIFLKYLLKKNRFIFVCKSAITAYILFVCCRYDIWNNTWTQTASQLGYILNGYLLFLCIFDHFSRNLGSVE